MSQTEAKIEVDGAILKSLIDKWQNRIVSLYHKDRLDYVDHTTMYIYKEVVKDLQKL